MGKLENKLADDLKGSIKSRDQVKTSTLRMVIASMQNLVIEKQVKDLEDGDVLKIISKQVKQHLDSIESFKKAERQELVEKEAKELEILRSYLPEQLSPERIEEIVKKAISETGASSKADFGKVIKHALQELKGQAGGKTVSTAVQKMLP